MVQSPDRICRHIGRVKILDPTFVEDVTCDFHPSSANEILLQVTIIERLNKNDWVTPKLKIQGAIPLLYGYR